MELPPIAEIASSTGGIGVHGNPGTRIDDLEYRAGCYYATPPNLIYKSGDTGAGTVALSDSMLWSNGLAVTPGGPNGGKVLVY